MIPVDLVTGFLGSGKTTLINALLRDPAFAGAMVIVNEFGEVGLDHLLVSTSDDQVVLLDSGCLCCAVSGTLRDTLIDLLARRALGRVDFHRVIVETSGLAHPGPLVASLLGDSALKPRCALSQVLTLVDGANGVGTLERYAEARRQVAFADRLIVTKLEDSSDDEARTIDAALTTLNAHAPIAAWRLGDSPAPFFAPLPHRGAARHTPDDAGSFLRGPLRSQYAESGAVHGASFGAVTTQVLSLPGTIDWATYAGWTQSLVVRFGKRLLRCKGLLALGDDGAPWVVQGVQGYFASPQRLDAWPASVGGGFLVCIGESISPADLESIFAEASSLPSR